MLKDNLGGIWKMKSLRQGNFYDATVPGSVMHTLLEKGTIEDPYYRDNEDKVLEYLKEDYELTRMLQITGEHLREDEVDLVFYGIDTIADIYLNGALLSSVDDMHRTYRFSIKGLVRPGANELKVVLHSPINFIEEYIANNEADISYAANGAINGSQYIRKAHSMFGWDFGPAIPDMGIFRDVELQSYSKSRIVDVIVKQYHEDGQVLLYIDPILKIVDNIPLDIEVTFGDMNPIRTMIRMPKAGKTMTEIGENTIEIPVDNPMLWWPHGLGQQNLYNLIVKVSKAGKLYDKRVMRIGLRTMEFSREKDQYGEDFAFVVNGVKIFAMGANYIPEDTIYSRVTRDKQEMLIKAASDANFNCLRVWGGGYYPSDDFYDLCDEYGIIVWQDLMFGCNIYELNEHFEKNIIAETKDNVRRIKHHACLGLWCGNNEIETAWENWEEFKCENKKHKADYVKIFEYLLPKAVSKMDEETFYWPSSPSSGGSFDNPEDETRGDAHYWSVWHGNKPFSEYRNHYFRFVSEFGFQSFPGIKTVKSFTKPEDRNVFSYVFEKHQKDKSANGKIMSYMADNFLYPKDFEGVLYVSQLLQSIAMKCAVEHFRRNKGRCNGALYWQHNDIWPGASWSGVDYYGRYKALNYVAKRFYEPISQSLIIEDAKEKKLGKYSHEEINVASYIANDSLDSTGVKCRMTLRAMDGKEIVRYDDSAHVLPGKVNKITTRDFARYIERNGKCNVYVEAVFEYTDRRTRYETFTFVPYKHLALNKPQLVVEISDQEDAYVITLLSDTFTPFVMLDLKRGDGIFDDNVIDLTAGIPRDIKLYKENVRDIEIPDIETLYGLLRIDYLQKSYMEDVIDDFVRKDKMTTDEDE